MALALVPPLVMSAGMTALVRPFASVLVFIWPRKQRSLD